MSNPLIQRYKDSTRLNHWFIAIVFCLAALSGLAFFHPSLFFLSHLFGGGTWTRILHPYLGLLMVLGFALLFFELWRDNLITQSDKTWLGKISALLAGNKNAMPAVGKYNGGQKLVFWMMSISLLVLLITGFMFWYTWFGRVFPIGLVRLAVVLHAVSAVVLILSVIVHVYAAIWVKGTVRAMTRGTVTQSWAKTNHALWHKQVTEK